MDAGARNAWHSNVEVIVHFLTHKKVIEKAKAKRLNRPPACRIRKRIRKGERRHADVPIKKQ